MGIGENNDEIQQHIDSRYVSTSEAVWWLFHYWMHEEKPNVVRLPVHTEGGHFVVFNPELNAPNEILENAAAKNSKLEAYFKLNKAEKEYADQHPENASTVM
ncbi:hypothetical protein EV359DRAFT_88275, partial [Lentinula novae-zelandiae]